MPNHITNELTPAGSSDALESFFDSIKGEHYDDGTPRHMDFNNIVPRPAELNITSGNGSHMAKIVFAGGELMVRHAPKDLSDEHWEDFIAALQNLRRHTHADWYSWSIENWGTKWNAFAQKREGNTLKFDTAWSGVRALITTLSKRFPDLSFEYRFADEDTGYNVGDMTIQNGATITDRTPTPGTREAYELAFELIGGREYYRLNSAGNYEYFDPDEEVA